MVLLLDLVSCHFSCVRSLAGVVLVVTLTFCHWCYKQMARILSCLKSHQTWSYKWSLNIQSKWQTSERFQLIVWFLKNCKIRGSNISKGVVAISSNAWFQILLFISTKLFLVTPSLKSLISNNGMLDLVELELIVNLPCFHLLVARHYAFFEG